MNNDPADLVQTAKRRRYALRCRQQGATYKEVAEACIEKWGADRLPNGYDERYAWKDIHRELEKARKEVEEEAETTLKLELRRLDEMQSRLYPVALGDGDTPPDPRAVDRVLRIMKRRAQLLGLDEPQELEHSGEAFNVTIQPPPSDDRD